MRKWVRYLLIGVALAALYFAVTYGIRHGACVVEWSPLNPPAHWC